MKLQLTAVLQSPQAQCSTLCLLPKLSHPVWEIKRPLTLFFCVLAISSSISLILFSEQGEGHGDVLRSNRVTNCACLPCTLIACHAKQLL